MIDHGELRAIGTPDMLARQMWQRMRVDVTVEAPLSPATLGSISSVPGVTAVNVSGSQVALELSKLEAVADVVALLVSQGARIHAVVPREHTLEDIYFQLQDTANSEEARP